MKSRVDQLASSSDASAPSAWRRLLSGRRRSAGATEAGMALTVAALIVGALLGTGLAATDVVTSDGLTWIDDGERGTVVQVNPTTGQPQTVLKVAPPGHPLEIAQRDGLLVIRDPITGEVTIIDVATLGANGRLGAGTGTDIKILLDADQLYLVDRPNGTIRRINPSTAADVGTAWTAGIAMVDVAIDGTGTVWALTIDGQLHALRWSAKTMTLADSAPVRQVDGTGSRSILVTHDEGVTVLAPEGAKVVRVGTDGGDTTLPAPRLDDQIDAPAESPAGLVPASVPSSATVLIVHDDQVRSVDVGQFGCPRPGRPVAYHDRVYVPCLGSGKVIVLDAEGHRQPPDILVPNGEPKLMVDDGRLIIYVPGAEVGVVVDADGTARPIRTHDDNVPPRDPNVRTTPPPLPTTNPTRPPRDTPTGQPNPNPPGTVAPPSTGAPTPPGGSSSDSPPPTTPPTTPPTLPPGTTPAGPSGPTGPPGAVGAQARPNGTVLVTWDPGGQADEYHIYRGDDLTEVASVAGAATSATVTTLAPGTDTTIFVEAWYGSLRVRSAETASVRVYTNADAPVRIDLRILSVAHHTLNVEATWSAANDNGSPIDHYSFSLWSDKGFSQDLNVTSLTSGQIAVECNGTCDELRVNAAVFGLNAAGNGTPIGTSIVYLPSVPPTITSLSCEYTANRTNTCHVEFTGDASIDWAYNNANAPSLYDQETVTIGCGGRSGGEVRVSVSNMAGLNTTTTRITQCSGPIP